MNEEVTQNHRGLKIIVIVLGILIVLMTGLIVATIAIRAGSREETPAPSATAAPAQAVLPVPPGSRLIRMETAEDQLFLHLHGDENRDYILVLDRETGALLWRRDLTPETP